MSITVMKQALEALYYAEHNLSAHDSRKMFEAITSLRQAIAEEQQSNISAYQRGYMDGLSKGRKEEK